MDKSVLKINNLKKIYHDKNGEIEAIKNIQLEVFDKEFLSIVGPSGCGKSSLLSILADLEKETNGNVEFCKPNLKIGYKLQNDSLFPWRTILDNCLIGLEINHELTPQNKDRVINLLKMYGLGEFMDKYPSSLSGGMRQRVG